MTQIGKESEIWHKVWGTISLLVLLVTLWFWGLTIGSPIVPDLPGAKGDVLVKDSRAAALFALVFCPPLFVLWAHFAKGVIASRLTRPRNERLPLPFADGLPTGAPGGDLLRGGFLFLLLGLVPAGQIHFFRYFLKGSIYPEGSPVALHHGGWEHLTHFAPLSCFFEDGFRFPNPTGQENAYTFFPGWEAWYFVIWIGAAIFVALRLWRLVLAAPQAAPAGAPAVAGAAGVDNPS